MGPGGVEAFDVDLHWIITMAVLLNISPFLAQLYRTWLLRALEDHRIDL